MNDILFELLIAIVVAIVGVVVRYLVPWLKGKIEGSKLETVMKWTSNIVSALEQIMKGKGLGAEKKAAAITYVKELVAKTKINITDEQIDLLIESAVKEMNDTSNK